jgi:hypothetical protein
VLRLTAVDGSVAVLEPLCPGAPPTGVVLPEDDQPTEGEPWAEDGESRLDLAALTTWATPPARIGLVLVRRGGYAVGVGEGDRLAGHKTGRRYVQSRTAAGGWSQQRFARRRGNQAAALTGAVADEAARVVLPAAPAALVAGGDRRLVADVLADDRLAPWAQLPRRELFDLPDPRLAVLELALRRGRAVRVRLTES